MVNTMSKPVILVVDDNPGTVELLERNLRERGYRVHSALAVRQAIQLLQAATVDLVITDVKMPGESGLDLVRYVRENLRDTEVMLITGYATVQGAVEAMKTGAEEYLVKPFTEEELFSAVSRVLEKLAARRTVQGKAPAPLAGPLGLIGASEPMQRVFRDITKAAESSATVLICGESGTGKEVVARAIHYASPRRSAPFVPVACGAIPEGLLESELFGHVKGAFTGAFQSRTGFFQAAENGTIFLDEISETTPGTQTKLLRVLQDREIYLVGSSRSRKIDVRVIAASNKNLTELVGKGSFREDLYYRINVIAIALPPLRDRGQDILLLVDHFAEKFAREFGRPRLSFSDQALHALCHYSWPGNVRELQNLVQRLVVMSDRQSIDIPDLPVSMRFSTAGPAGLRSLAEVEADHIRSVLAAVGGNRSEAARVLGIDRKTLREKLKRYQISG
ncbi:MAG: sigma-54-dependent transcriptional regulator [Acidobacteriota bacterium]